ncbi:MAG TPA: hypothetical protein VK157_16035 [Phycisphaerales bacterium]|nr:hypothetical protein [Phycisphaerales bacterium]
MASGTRILRIAAAILIAGGAIGAMAQSTAFAMSWPYANGMLLATNAPHSVWKPIPPERLESARQAFETFGGWDRIVPWDYLTDWLWFLLIAPGLSMVFALLVPSVVGMRRIGMILMACAVACAIWYVYRWAAVTHETTPVAIAQQRLGDIFALLTVAVGGVATIAFASVARKPLRRFLAAFGNERTLRAFDGLWSADGLTRPSAL